LVKANTLSCSIKDILLALALTYDRNGSTAGCEPYTLSQRKFVIKCHGYDTNPQIATQLINHLEDQKMLNHVGALKRESVFHLLVES